MKKKRLLSGAAVTVIALALSPSIAARAGSASQEIAPVAQGVAHPVSASASAEGATTAGGFVPDRPGSVDDATYADEKANAVGATGPALVNGVQSSVPVNFTGLNRPGAVNHGFVFNPPDTIVGKSPTHVLEGVNSALRLFNTAGSVLSTMDLNTFFGAATSSGLAYDPKVFYDRNTANRRMIVVALQAAGVGDTNTTNDISRILFAVSRNTDPTSLASSQWCRYNISGVRNPSTSLVSWADYPQIGVGADTFNLSVNNFRFTDKAFTFAIVRSFRKLVMENNAGSCPSVPFFTFQPTTTAGNFSVFTLQPAQSYTTPSSFTGTTNPAYFINTSRGTSTLYRVWRVRNVGASPSMQLVNLTSNITYSIPPSSPQPGTSVKLDTGDDRVLQVGGIGNTLIGTLTTGCNFTSGSAVESCSLSPRVSVGQNSSGVMTAALAENTFTGLGDNIFVHHNSIASNTGLKSGASWQFSGTGFRLSSQALTKVVNGGWSTVSTYAGGSCSSTATNRTGDYSGAQLDPSDLTSFWLAGERNIVLGGSCQWETRVAKLVP